MNLRAQLAEALAIFDQCDAKAALIGGLALAAHRVVRATTDIDFLLDASSYREVCNALVAAGFECLHESADAANFARGGERLDFILAHRPRAREMLDQAEDRTIYGRNLRVVAVESLIALKLQAMPCMSNSRLNDPLIVASGGIEQPADGDPLEALFALTNLVGDLCPDLPDKPICPGTVYLL